ncbi:hypothetical protein SAMN05216382_2645 [Sphingomonas palmae]|uniref:Nucleotidyltransferase domain-containing protein n=1 Tax=Sphingomonas palmae TaxID=1855283 RepID=A0A1H7T3T3_9SPHN|nr:hypothetical protein [Sphingomonas palmae]SEL78924.1 hypothetical protein SAMN05216382_2645 [Sphingomonas palmae]
MSIDYASSLSRLRNRRLGADRAGIALAQALPVVERYQKRASSEATRYTLGAMQEVDPDYTAKSNEEAERVIAALRSSLTAADRYAEFRQQGSVPANTHIRGASDVDLLVLGGVHTYDPGGVRARAGLYLPWNGSIVQEIDDLRCECEDILKRRYWAATIDTTKPKSIRMSEGSLTRDVDVVPAHWSDNVTYQASLLERDRGVCILDRSVPTTTMNLPFLHIDRLNVGDLPALGGLKMSIRLLKNLKADSSRTIGLSSYDMAGLMWNCDARLIRYHAGRELSVLLGTDQWLEWLVTNPAEAGRLMTPDGIRRVLDEGEKFKALTVLAGEVSALREAVAAEWMPILKSERGGFAADRRALLEDVTIPG